MAAAFGMCGCGKSGPEFSVPKASAGTSVDLAKIQPGTWSGSTRVGKEQLTVTFEVHPKERKIKDVLIDWGGMYAKADSVSIQDDCSFEYDTEGVSLKGRFLSETYAEGTAEPVGSIVRVDADEVTEWRLAPK
jgi:hypothetical protein